MNVNAKDKATGKEQSIVIKASSGLSDEEIEGMVNDAEANAAEDQKFEELVQARNAADGLAHAATKTVQEAGDKATDEEKEMYKRALNLKLINLMITEIPNESKFCVSYGQLQGCYWTIPATSTQGTTKEGDKDYIVRASLSADLDLDLHKKVFLNFVESI